MFGSVRSHCGNNRIPNVKQFIGALKTCIVNNFAFNEVSQGANCQDDDSSLLSSLQTLLTSRTCETSNGVYLLIKLIVKAHQLQLALIQTDTLSLPTDLTATAYVSGFIAKRVLSTNSCNNCKLGILSGNPHESHSLGLLFREYNNDKERLTYPSESLAKTVGHCATLLETLLEDQFYKVGILKLVASILVKEVDFSWLNLYCAEHSGTVSSHIVNSVCRIGIPWWCKRYNRKLVSN